MSNTSTERFAPQMKTYVLLETTKSPVEIYRRVNKDQRVRDVVKPYDAPYLQITFVDKTGNNKTIRLKLNSNTIYQDEQIKTGILANEKFTDTERNVIGFKNGVLMTNIKIVQEFLEAHPQYDKFEGICHEVKQKLYTLYDRTVEIKTQNEITRKRIKAAAKIYDLDLSSAQAMMIRLNGGFFKTPDTIEECQNGLIEFLDQANEVALDDLLKDDSNIDEQVEVLIGMALKHNIISFDLVENHVVRVAEDGRFIPLKQISSSQDKEERKRYFSEFLTSPDGRLVLDDIKKRVHEKESKSVVVPVKENKSVVEQESEVGSVAEVKEESVKDDSKKQSSKKGK